MTTSADTPDVFPKPMHPAVAAALAMPPMTDEECAEVGRIFAAIERRRQQRPAEQKSEVA